MTVGELMTWATAQIRAAEPNTPELDASFIIAHILRTEPNDLTMNKTVPVSLLNTWRIRRAVRQRVKHKPVAYILGYRYFYKDKLLVSPRCLIPRPDTEHLIYAAEKLSPPPRLILDIGSGSGAIAISLARVFPESVVVATDIDVDSLRENIRHTGIKNVIPYRHDVFSQVPLPHKRYHLIVSNPPYLSDSEMAALPEEVKNYEPRSALYGGADGLAYYRRIAELSKYILAKNGTVILEVDHKWEKVRDLFIRRGFHDIKSEKDYNHLERVLIIRHA